MQTCISDVKQWRTSDNLVHNDKTVLIVIASRHLFRNAAVNTIRVKNCEVSKVSVVRNGSHTHITKISSTAFYHLQNITHIRKYLAMVSWILSALLLVAGLTIVLVYYMVCLGAILTTCLNAEQIFPYYPMLHQLPLLHWLPISFRINFKILLLAFKAIHELAPSYIQMILLKLSLSTQDIDCDLTTEHCCLIRFLNFDNPRRPGFRCYGDLTLELCISGNKNGQIS